MAIVENTYQINKLTYYLSCTAINFISRIRLMVSIPDKSADTVLL